MCKNNHLFTIALFTKFVYLSYAFIFYANTISPLQQIGLGSTCSKNPLMKRDSVQMTTNIPFGLGSNNGAIQLTPPQSPAMKNNVCHEVESPFKQHVEIRFTLDSKKKQPPLEPMDLLDKFGMEFTSRKLPFCNWSM